MTAPGVPRPILIGAVAEGRYDWLSQVNEDYPTVEQSVEQSVAHAFAVGDGVFSPSEHLSSIAACGYARRTGMIVTPEWRCPRCILAIEAEAAAGGLDFDALRATFLRLLTVDSETQDARKRDFNQAIFNAEQGWAVFNGTDLDMVMEKFDKAARLAQEEGA